MTKRERAKLSEVWDKGYGEGFAQGRIAGIAIGKVEEAKIQEEQRKNRVLEANLKLANSLGQMVQAVSDAVRSFTSDNNTLH